MSAPPAAAASFPGPVLVMGAGSIGCFVGGLLAAAGCAVSFVGRPRVLDALAVHGLTLSDLDGARRHIPPDELSPDARARRGLAPGEGPDAVQATGLRLSTHVPSNAGPALVLLTVKSGATAEAAAELGRMLAPGTLVLSLQNGVTNAADAQAAAPHLRVLPGMVPYNVAELAPGHFHRGTAGALAAQDDAALRPWVEPWRQAGLPLVLHADLRPVQWGKLLLNLNNPVNALSGLPLRAELLDRGYRRCFAALIDEALAVLAAAGITPSQVTAVKPHALPKLLRLPTPVFRLIAARMLRIDAKARSSMADDLAQRRVTEIDALCGEVVRVARAHGRDAPLNRRMVALIDDLTIGTASSNSTRLWERLTRV